MFDLSLHVVSDMNMKVQLFSAEILCASLLILFAEMVASFDTTFPPFSTSVNPLLSTINSSDGNITTQNQITMNIPDDQSESSASVKPSTLASPTTPATTTNNFFPSVLKRDCLQLFFICSGLMMACAILLISICILAFKVCHLSKQLKTLRVNRELMEESGCLVNLTETKLLSNTSQEKLELSNGTTVEEEGLTNKEDGEHTVSENPDKASLPSSTESASLKPQGEATSSELPLAAAPEPSGGAEQPEKASE